MFRVGYNVKVREDNTPDKKGPKDAKDAKAKKPPPFKKDAPEEDTKKPEEGPADGGDEDKGLALERAAKTLELDTKLLEAMCLGRAYGGAVLFVGFADGHAPDQPLDEENPGELKFLTVFDRREMIVHEWYNDPLAPNYGMPKSYMLYPQYFLDSSNQQQVSGLIVHESRCIRFEGTHADRRERVKLWGWTYSVLQPVYSVVRDFENLFRSMGYMVQDANQSVFKLSGLMDQISNNATELQARMRLMENTRAVNRAVLLDADEQEDFLKIPTTFSGVPDICDRFQQRLSAATGIPVTL